MIGYFYIYSWLRGLLTGKQSLNLKVLLVFLFIKLLNYYLVNIFDGIRSINNSPEGFFQLIILHLYLLLEFRSLIYLISIVLPCGALLFIHLHKEDYIRLWKSNVTIFTPLKIQALSWGISYSWISIPIQNHMYAILQVIEYLLLKFPSVSRKKLVNDLIIWSVFAFEIVVNCFPS